MYLFFDTETTGTEPGSRITQLAWQMYSSEGKCFAKYSELIKPDGWTIPTVDELTAKGNKNPHFFEQNNMSTERCEKEGKPIKHALDAFTKAIENCKYMIAHNLQFDVRILAHEIKLLNVSTINKPFKICTMNSTTLICKIPNVGRSGFKWPKLEELHRFLFNCDFDGAHDAGADVAATAKCFFQLLKLNLIRLPIEQENIADMKIKAYEETVEPIFVSTTHTKPYLNKGTEEYKFNVEQLLQGKVTISQIQEKFILSKEMNELLQTLIL